MPLNASCRPIALAALAALLAVPILAAAQAQVTIPVLAPTTGFLSLEGTSQRNGAVLAIKNAPPSVKVNYSVTDTGASPEGATTAMERALSRDKVTAVAAPMLGPQMLALLPIALGSLHDRFGGYGAGLAIAAVVVATAFVGAAVLRVAWRRSWVAEAPV